MPLPAKIRSMQVRPIQSADLAFSIPGILHDQNQAIARLGAPVTRFDLETLYRQLGDTVSGHPEKLKFDAVAIKAALANASLFELRNESIKASLAEGLAERESAFLERFAAKGDIVNAFAAVYPAAVTPRSKLGRLNALVSKADLLATEIASALVQQNRTGVITETVTDVTGASTSLADSSSVSTSAGDSTSQSTGTSTSTADSNYTSHSTSDSHGSSQSTTQTTLLAMRTQTAVDRQGDDHDVVPPNTHLVTVKQNIHLTQNVLDTPTEAGHWKPLQHQLSEDQITVPYRFDGGHWVATTVPSLDTQTIALTSLDAGTSVVTGNSDSRGTGTTVSQTTGHETSRTDSSARTNTAGSSTSQARTVLDEFRHPSVENELRLQRTQANLQDEVLSQTVFSYRVQSLDRILDNQLTVLDMRLRQLQLAFAATFLTSPITGVVTGLYKDKGESVQAGEPVLRVENHEFMLLVGQVQVRGLVRLQDPVSIRVRNVFEDGQPMNLSGTVVSVRGHDSDNDEWDLIIECDNRANGGGTKLPINYSFDYTDIDSMQIG